MLTLLPPTFFAELERNKTKRLSMARKSKKKDTYLEMMLQVSLQHVAQGHIIYDPAG